VGKPKIPQIRGGKRGRKKKTVALLSFEAQRGKKNFFYSSEFYNKDRGKERGGEK